MFSHLTAAFFYAVAIFAILAAAMPWDTTTTKPPATTTTVTVTAPPVTTTIPASQCSTGDAQCCNSVQSANSPSAAKLLGLLGIIVQDVTIPVGITCSPITAIGVGGTSCNQQAVCCENNSFDGLVAIGCTPINISL